MFSRNDTPASSAPTPSTPPAPDGHSAASQPTKSATAAGEDGVRYQPPPRPTPEFAERLNIRTAIPDQDREHILRLYELGLLTDDGQEEDSAEDLLALAEHYLATSGSGFWIAELLDPEGPRIVGMIGVLDKGESVAEIRRLRVDPNERMKGIGTRLIEEALNFCRRNERLKVVLDTRVERGPAIALFERLGFQLNRTRSLGSKVIVEFYLDLYRDHDDESE